MEVKPPIKPREAPKPTKENVDGWAGVLYMLHFMGAKVLKVPEMQIAQPTAENLSAASLNFLRHIMPVGAISEFAQDTVALATVLGATYVPMASAVAERKAREKAAAKAAPPPAGMNSAGGFEVPPHPDDMEVVGHG